ncbi:HNH endonuclease [Butyrivibrio sp. INlla14]|uniref:HNH endonuclease n=1 Tax=Butyrivibrio sp. INlla14 TaxID=1520808 RepID=UPI000877227A|nr:HNH endonuclease [Butyrivibrio sp. INlla14]SCY74227.1 HNH endonuclease [Butyrivibrio sp. INlla14]
MVKICRSFPAPPSLELEAKKANGSYNKPDVVTRLRDDFNDKCYICELKGLQDPEVEHLIPHENGKYHDRMFDWNNLFFVCKHCNGVKKAKKYDSGIIDCCRQDPEKLLDFDFEAGIIKVSALDKNDKKSALTAELIYEVFNNSNSGIQLVATEKRVKGLSESMNILYKELQKYKSNPRSKRNQRTLKAILRKESDFAAFKRNYVRKRLDEYPELNTYVS